MCGTIRPRKLMLPTTAVAAEGKEHRRHRDLKAGARHVYAKAARQPVGEGEQVALPHAEHAQRRACRHIYAEHNNIVPAFERYVGFDYACRAREVAARHLVERRRQPRKERVDGYADEYQPHGAEPALHERTYTMAKASSPPKKENSGDR